MNQERTEYFTDKELEEFIAEIEDGHEMQAPDYMEAMILHKAKHQAVRDSVEIMPIRNTIRETIQEGKMPVKAPVSKRRQLITYSIKIIAAAAAAIALIIRMPVMENRFENQTDSRQIQYEQNSEKKATSVIRNLNEKSSDFCSRLFDSTNQIFYREDK